MINVEQLLNLSVRLAAICLGGLFSIKVDIFNLALEGFTLFGCFAAVVGTYMTQSVAGGIAFAVLVTLLIALIYALFVF
ncbi:MAG: ABC transporter permease, partial [Anaerotruncus colihominis]